jgi:EpsI family protein
MLALLTVAAGWSVTMRQGKAGALQRSFADFPRQIGKWEGSVQQDFPESVLAVLQPTDYLHRHYRRAADGVTVNFYVGFYQHQRAGESMHSPKNCLPGAGYEVLESKRVMMDLPQAGKSIEVNHYIVQSQTEKQFVLYWYETHGRAFASEYQGKAILVWEALRTGRTDGALIRVMLPFTGPSPAAAAVTHEFAREVYPILRSYLPAE